MRCTKKGVLSFINNTPNPPTIAIKKDKPKDNSTLFYVHREIKRQGIFMNNSRPFNATAAKNIR